MTPGNDDQIKYHSFNDNINNSNERYNQNKNKRYSLVEVDENNNIKKIIQEDYNPDNKNILRELNLNLIKLQQLEIESLNNIKRINSRVLEILNL